ncbi:DNA ligase [Aquincola tertiaricarbonis]|uniref:DNA ligase n=1 Tax=Aquincola tertiaricarbonis TaxID=391953 RepID=UPI000698942A|nr:DNA ligase [Aquincola tertiaricarbonis]
MPHPPSRTRRRLVAAGIAFIATHGQAAPPPPRMVLAREFRAGDHPAGHLVSEKYDGVRAQWDGQALRFRGGGLVAAPAAFTARLPAVPLDGELWLGRGRFDALSGLVRQARPDDAGWQALRYMVFELPGGAGSFEQRAAEIDRLARAVAWPQLVAVPHERIAEPAALMRRLAEVTRAGGEGLMLHRADAPYVTGRTDVLLKLKPEQDAEAQVIGHRPGQGRHAGRLGALQVRTPEGIVFEIGTGLTDAQRDAPPPVGAWVTYRHRGFTARGVPRFASFLRVRVLP